jgi:DNA polymerase
MDKREAVKQIRDEVLALTSSPLYVYRTENSYTPVIGEGSHDTHILFVGEAPGEQEAKSARPFCGRSGKLLDEMLTSISLDREKVYIANLVKDRPQDNRDPTPEEIALYAPFMNRQIPEILQQLGHMAAWLGPT